MSEPSEHLAALAAACGVDLAYHDIWGKERRAGDETLRSVLGAMGYDVSTDEGVRRALVQHGQRDWADPLPPVIVLRRSIHEPVVPICLAEEALAAPLRYRLLLEDGSERAGEVAPAGLEVLERKETDRGAFRRVLLPLGEFPPPGYHRFEIEGQGLSSGRTSTRLVSAPERCYWPESLAFDQRVFGPDVQLYALRSARNWGIGDFTDLRSLVDAAGTRGAGIIGLNPMHALFPENPQHASPYSPSSRSFRNVLYLDVEAIEDFAECDELKRETQDPRFRARLVSLRKTELVRYLSVARVKRPILERIWGLFRERQLAAGTARGEEFRRFCEQGGPLLEAFGTFEALSERFAAERAGKGSWHAWPEGYRRAGTPEVAAFAEEHRDRVQFFQYLQWQCEQQLGAAGRRCEERGMRIGLYFDLAVSFDGAGFEGWYRPELYALEARIGAPPDDFNLSGQDWGLPPAIPERLREAGYEPFAEALRANMAHAGALRIDHVMGLMRSFWVPPGRGAADGTYVRYPFDELLGILTLESERNRCVVIGEDLGTVPDAVRERLPAAGVLSYRLLYFMKEPDGGFTPPDRWPENALAAVTTHDLPTLAGWWAGRDIEARAELSLFPDDASREEAVRSRERDRELLLAALQGERLLPAAPQGRDLKPATFGVMEPALARAVHAYLARCRSKIAMLRLEDVVLQRDQVNLPGTTDQYPNWRRKLPVGLEALEGDERFLDLAQVATRERGEGRVRKPRPDAPEGDQEPARPFIPRATYRLQLRRGFGFDQAAELVDYLDRLGVSHLYLSPLLEARPGSPHGYDVIDHGRLNDELGGEPAFERLVGELAARRMGLLVDTVPNHMGVGSDNPWWMSVLEHGRASPYADFFDIDWTPREAELRERVLLPVLEDQYGIVLERGLLRLEFNELAGEFVVAYHDQRFPIDPRTVSPILREAKEQRPDLDAEAAAELEEIASRLEQLPARDELEPARVEQRLREAAGLGPRLASLCQRSDTVRALIAARAAAWNGTAGDPASFDQIHRLLERQAYRLAYWRVAADEINYRRFFEINDLAGLRMESRRAFEETHRYLLELVRGGKIQGLRLDHPDGLADPADYFRRLREALGGPADGDGPPATYVVAEKILAAHERLPADWPIHGTTGYEFGNEVHAVLVDGRAERAMDRAYARFIGRWIDFDALLLANKKLILETSLSGEWKVLASHLDRISEIDRRTRDFTFERLRGALAEVIACLPVYRTYITRDAISPEDQNHVEWAVALARRVSRAADTSVFDFIRGVLLQPPDGDAGSAISAFLAKFQQTTGAVMAKGLEDTTFYSYNRLLSANEVGGDPRRFSISRAAFHQAASERARRWPHSLLATSTHDSKRSEDARARIASLTAVPDRWEQAVRRWARFNRSRKQVVDGRRAPSRNDEYAFYQTLVAIWPAGTPGTAGTTEPPGEAELLELSARLCEYLRKAAREAKVETSWINPNEPYEAALTGFVEAVLASAATHPFLLDFHSFHAPVARLAVYHSIAQTLIKLTAPGVPDIYQGNELWTYALVDPDNRRPVDYERRRRLLDELDAIIEKAGRAEGASALPELCAELLRAPFDGRLKLFVTRRALALRKGRPALFADGDYRPLSTAGGRAEHLLAFARSGEDAEAIVVVPLHCGSLVDPDSAEPLLGQAVWEDSAIELPSYAAGRHYLNVFTGETLEPAGVAEGGARLAAASVLARFPVALLVAFEPGSAQPLQ